MKDMTHRIAIGFGAFIALIIVMCVVAKVMMSGKEDAGASKNNSAMKTVSSENTVVSAEKTADGLEQSDDMDTSGVTAGDILTEPVASDEHSDTQNSGTMAGADTQKQDADTESRTPDNGSTSQPAADTSADTSSTAEGTSGQNAVRDGKKVVCIDPAHQIDPDYSLEPLGPGSSDTKISVTWGAEGATTGIREYKYTLELGLMLRDELESRGYAVYMTRTTNDVHISDVTRAKMANENADIVIHIHANASEDDTQRGIMTFYPSEDNPYSAKYSAESKKLSTAVLRCAAEATGAISRGVIDLDDQSSLNWTTIPVTHIETGFLSTPEDEAIMLTDEYKADMVQGIADGVDLYFGY